MKEKASRQNQINQLIILFCFIMIVLLFALFFYKKSKLTDTGTAMHSGIHILVLLPDISGNDFQKLRDEIQAVTDKYDFRIEFQSLSTVSAQKQMLSLVPVSDIEAVLLWPISNVDEDYSDELMACDEQDIPVVMIGHDLEDKSLRNSFIGSGIGSELMVINQTLFQKDGGRPIIIGSCSNSASGKIYELLVMRTEENMEFDSSVIQSERLKELVKNHPNNYYANACIQIKAGMNEPVSLNLKLVNTLQGLEDIELFFSLDENLTAVLATSVESRALMKNNDFSVIGYGSVSEMQSYIEAGIIDELVVSKTAYSAMIGLLYLNDILRGFFIPSPLDSGVELITADNLSLYTGVTK